MCASLSSSRNPYFRSPEIARLQPSVVVLMDILGYIEMTNKANRSGQDQSFLDELYEPLRIARRWLTDENIEIDEPTQKDEFVFRAFTDNIVMGWPLQTTSVSAVGSTLRRVLSKVSAFQLEMAIHGFFVRGAVSVGRVFIDDIAVVGPALTDAYLAERAVVDTPRVMLTSSGARAVMAHRKAYGKGKQNPLSEYLCLDSDDCLFVNYLVAGLSNTDLIARHRDVVLSKIKEFQRDIKLLRKYQWAAQYHDEFCIEHADLLPKEMHLSL